MCMKSYFRLSTALFFEINYPLLSLPSGLSLKRSLPTTSGDDRVGSLPIGMLSQKRSILFSGNGMGWPQILRSTQNDNQEESRKMAWETM